MAEQKNVVQKSPLKAIRAFCLDCVGSANEVKICVCKRCALYDFRMGKNPFLKQAELTDEQKAERAEHLRHARTMQNRQRKTD